MVDPEKIAIRYFKMKFWTDLLATVPLDYFSPALRFTGLLRLIRMTRLLEVSSIDREFESSFLIRSGPCLSPSVAESSSQTSY